METNMNRDKIIFDTMGEQIKTIIESLNSNPLVFDTEKEAEVYYYKNNDCMSDDVDDEEYRFVTWCEDNKVIIKENE